MVRDLILNQDYRVKFLGYQNDDPEVSLYAVRLYYQWVPMLVKDSCIITVLPVIALKNFRKELKQYKRESGIADEEKVYKA